MTYQIASEAVVMLASVEVDSSRSIQRLPNSRTRMAMKSRLSSALPARSRSRLRPMFRTP